MQRAAASSPTQPQSSPQTPTSQSNFLAHAGNSAVSSASATPITQPPSKKARLAQYVSTPSGFNPNPFSALAPDATLDTNPDYAVAIDSPAVAGSPFVFTPQSGTGPKETQWAFSYRVEEDDGAGERQGALRVESLRSLEGVEDDDDGGMEGAPWGAKDEGVGRKVFGEFAGRRKWVQGRLKRAAGVGGDGGEGEVRYVVSVL